MTCLRSSRPSDGDQCPQATQIVNQDVLVTRPLKPVPYGSLGSESKPPGVY